jgi:hypothetical protein
MDFTLTAYQSLIYSLQTHDFSFQTFDQFIAKPGSKVVVLRHDVDLLPLSSLRMAEIENHFQIKASYYFRIVPRSYNEIIIKQIQELGHEIGYHYEDLTFTKGDIDEAYELFCNNLEKIRKLYPVTTICMHGSPMSKWDSRDIWKKYDYKKLGLTGEPSFDIDFNKVLYLTETGRRWDGNKVSVRDKATQKITTKWPAYHSTQDIIRAIENDQFPETAMINVHPQRWSDNVLAWSKEWIMQNLKNSVKKYFFVKH